MNATVYTPRNELRDSIDHIWYHNVPDLCQTTVTIPFLHQELVFNLGDRFGLGTGSAAVSWYDRSGLFTGIHTTPVTTHVTGHYRAMGIMFKPYGIHHLLGLPAWQLSSPVSPRTFSGLASITDPATVIKTPSAAIEHLEKWLLSIARPKPLPTIISDMEHTIAEGPFRKGRLRKFAITSGHTPKKLIDTFRETVGHPPGTYLQLVQINKAIRQLAADPSVPLTQVAYDQGFYDQPHFIRLFFRYAGMTPSRFKKALTSGKAHLAFPNTLFC